MTNQLILSLQQFVKFSFVSILKEKLISYLVIVEL